MDGFFGFAILLILLVFAYASGKVVDQSEVAFDCKNYGKTQINSKWYDCKPKEPSHD